MASVLDRIKVITRDLYPRGRAFKMPAEGIMDRLHSALALSEARAYSDALAILDSTIADNPAFSADDATAWEIRLGLISGAGTSLADRIKAINQKLNYPGTDAPRQHFTFLEAELQAAGFNVQVYENNFAGVTQTPEDLIGILSSAAYHDPTVYHGTKTHGARYSNIIANYLEESKDASFVIGSNYRSTFFIAGVTVSTFADVPAARKDEFRQLILKLKPAQAIGFLFVNYI